MNTMKKQHQEENGNGSECQQSNGKVKTRAPTAKKEQQQKQKHQQQRPRQKQVQNDQQKLRVGLHFQHKRNITKDYLSNCKKNDWNEVRRIMLIHFTEVQHFLEYTKNKKNA